MSMKPPFQMEIPRRSTSCEEGKEVLVPGAEYYSVLADDSQGNLQRHDFCSACWEGIKNNPKPNARTFWKSKVIAKKSEIDAFQNRDERALSLLKDMLKSNSADDYAEAFVLSLYLVRRKVLVSRQQMRHEDGSTIGIYEIVATEEMLGIRVVNLQQIQVDTIQQRLAEKLANRPNSQSH